MNEYLHINQKGKIYYASEKKPCTHRVRFIRSKNQIEIETRKGQSFSERLYKDKTYIKIVSWVLVHYEKILEKQYKQHKRVENIKKLISMDVCT